MHKAILFSDPQGKFTLRKFIMHLQLFLMSAVMMTATMSLAKDLPTDLKDLPTQRDLPDLFTFNDGKKVKSLENWKERRQELIKPLMFYQYGSMPPIPDQVMFRTDKE